jgi:hypothetical protein
VKPVLGVNYFPGWWNGPGNHWFTNGSFLLDKHPERTPLLGIAATPDLLAREAETAHAHGIAFFNFLWYGVSVQEPLERCERTEEEIAHINSSLDAFLRTCDDSPLRFTIEWTNHFPWSAIDAATWRRLVEIWVPIFANRRYMTIGGRLLFKIHSWHCWAITVEDRMERRRMIRYLRQVVRERTGKDMLIGTGVRRRQGIVAGHPLALDGTFDFTSIYLDVPNMVATDPDFLGPGNFSYRELERHQALGRAFHAFDVVPFVPNVVVGFHPLSKAQADLPQFDAPTKSEFAGAIDAALTDVRRYPGLRFPAQPLAPASVVLIYAWNEYAEGGFLAPSAAHGNDYLDVLRSVMESRR